MSDLSDLSGAISDAAAGARDAVRDVTAADFEATVAESSERLVVFDFWAPWCGPCRQLGPILEAVATESGGKVLLAKINTDQEQQLAAAFGVQSLPTVIAMRDGQPVDAFQGALPEAQVREWVGKLMPSPADDLVAASMTQPDVQTAIGMLREALQHDPEHGPATLALARALVEDNQSDEATRLLDDRERKFGRLEAEGEQIRSEIELRAATESSDLADARAAADANPDDAGLQVRLAEALAGDGKNEEALHVALEVVRADRGEHREAAKTLMLRLFDRLQGSPIVSQYRKRLTTLLIV